MSTPDLAEPIRTAIVGDSGITALLGTHLGAPAVFTRRPVPGQDVAYPMIAVSTDIEVLNEDGLADFRLAIRRDVTVYGRNDTAEHSTLVRQIGFLLFNLFHRQKRAITVADWSITDIIALGPITTPTVDDQVFGLLVPVTTKLAQIRVAEGAAAGFSPTEDIPGLIGWLDASDIDTLYQTDNTSTPITTNNQTVGRATDKSGVGHHFLMTTAVNRPTYKSNGGTPSGLAGIEFVDSPDATALKVSGPVNFFNLGGDKLSVFAVVRQNTSASNTRICDYVADGQTEDFNNVSSAAIMYYPSGHLTVSAFRSGSQRSNATIQDSTFYQLASIFDGAAHTMYVNNVAATPVADSGNFGAFGEFCIGVRPTFVEAGRFTLCEMLITNTAPDATLRAQIAAYLLDKWGVG